MATASRVEKAYYAEKAQWSRLAEEARYAATAGSAGEATHAATADYATNAGHATTADSATNATNAVNLTGTAASGVTGVTQSPGDNSTKLSTTAYADAAAAAAGALASKTSEVQALSASVAGNALTISAGQLSLDFRSTTLSSGAVTRVVGTPANLVVSSGSTLGTVNGVQSDIVVLVLNNAGTLELAVSNLAGGVNLTETGLISTTAEGGAGGADSAAVVYSATARTNVAYRVLGVISSTQATAGNWATAPSLVQGAGGEALAAMSSLGYGQTWQNLTASRAIGAVYYNTTGRPILVSVYAQNTAANGTFYLSVFGAVPSVSSGAAIAGGLTTLNPVLVPSGANYSIVNNSGTNTLFAWFEFR